MKWLLVACLLLVPTVSAYDESAAPALRDDVVRVWHEPETPQPGEQWTGGIEFQPGHHVTQVKYQICRVGQACFAPPTLAVMDGADAWSFDTSDYRVGENTVAWGIEDGKDWRVGVQYILTINGTDEMFPHGVEFTDARCDEDGELGYQGCSETHYLAFDMPGQPLDQGAPGLSILLVALALFLVAKRR